MRTLVLLVFFSAFCLAASRPQVLSEGRAGTVSVRAILIGPREFTPERVKALSLEYWAARKEQRFAKLSIYTSLDDWESTISGPVAERVYAEWTKRRAALLSVPASYAEMIAMNGSAVLRYSELGGRMVRVVLGGKNNLLFSIGGHQCEVVSVYASARNSTPPDPYLDFYIKTAGPMEFGFAEEALGFMRRFIGLGDKSLAITLRNDIWFQQDNLFPIAYRLYADQQVSAFEEYRRSPSISCGGKRCSSIYEGGRGWVGPDFPTAR